MRSSVEINHHDVPMIKFRALGTHYPTGKYKKSHNKDLKRTLHWFVLEIDGNHLSTKWRLVNVKLPPDQ